MDPTTPSDVPELSNPEVWGALPQLPASAVARDHPQRWAATGVPDTLAELDLQMETLWAAIQLALSGADHDTLRHTLRISDDIARHIIVAVTEHLVTTGPDISPPDTGAGGQASRLTGSTTPP